MEVPREEDWSGLPFPPPGALPDPGIKAAFLGSPALAGRFFTIVPFCFLYNLLISYFARLLPARRQTLQEQVSLFSVFHGVGAHKCLLTEFATLQTLPLTFIFFLRFFQL